MFKRVISFVMSLCLTLAGISVFLGDTSLFSLTAFAEENR